MDEDEDGGGGKGERINGARNSIPPGGKGESKGAREASPSSAPTLRVPGNALLAKRHISTANPTLSLHARARRLLTQDPRQTGRPTTCAWDALSGFSDQKDASSSGFALPAKFTMLVRSGDDGGQILALIDSENRRHRGLQ